VVNATEFPVEFEKLTALNAKNQFLPAIKARDAACISDHCPFFIKGVPCFYIYTWRQRSLS